MFKSVNDGKLPERATKYSAGFDVFANDDMVIGAGETKVIGLGIVIDTSIFPIICEENSTQPNLDMIMERYYLELHPRSSLRVKGLGGGVGIIDMDYREEIKMVISNSPNNKHLDEMYKGYAKCNYSSFKIKRGDKIGQLLLKRHDGWLLPTEYTKDEERNGGFGSTD